MGNFYTHFNLNHSVEYARMDEYRGEPFQVHTNTIEGEWSLLKKQYKTMNGTSEELFETYLYEFVFRKFFPNNCFGHFVQWLNIFYEHN